MIQEAIVVHGNRQLTGTVGISGAKNSALKLMAASILAQGECVIRNVPIISDIEIMAEVIQGLGATLGRNGHIDRDEHVVTIDTSTLSSYEAPYELVSKMRASIEVLGPLIGRFGKAEVAMPGGCPIGSRSIDIHLDGLGALGANIVLDHGVLYATTPNGLHGTTINFDFPSVGATDNVVMAAVVAQGTTVIENAAREPEIVDLCDMLRKMGAKIEGDGTSRIVIEGVPLETLKPCDHTTIGDRIEAGTFLVGGALTGGPVTVTGVNPDHLGRPLAALRSAGCDIEIGEDSITLSRTRPLKPLEIQTLPYPGFPTDLQAQFMVLCCMTDGKSFVTENIFENRFMVVSEMSRMGAQVGIEGHHAMVTGTGHLQGSPVKCSDLRAGAALALAGVIADGTTELHKIEHIDRGYEDFVGKMTSLGADVERVGIEVVEEEPVL